VSAKKKATGAREGLLRKVEAVIPRRLSMSDRKQLALIVINHTTRQINSAPDVAARKRRERELAKIAEQLRDRFKRLNIKLRRHGLQEELKQARAYMLPKPNQRRLVGRSACVDLNLIARVGLLALKLWDKRYRAKPRRPVSVITTLGEELRVILCPPLSENEYAHVLDAINGTGILPKSPDGKKAKLSADTQRTRRRRSGSK
jgi:hypothetical protein